MSLIKNKILIFLFLIIGLTRGTCIGQNYTDTIRLKEVIIKGTKTHKFGVGTFIHKIDSLSKMNFDSGNLADLLSSSMPIYIKKKSDGFSTISLRGTSANHTAILINGINVNSLTLGHSNLGNIDLFMFDKVNLQLGSAGALYGSDAIGGTINLNLNKNMTNGHKLYIKEEYSSLENQFIGLKYFVGNKKIESKTRIYYTNNRNRFKFKNLQRFDFKLKKYPTEYTNNSRKENYGIIQQLIFKPNLKNKFDVMTWFQRNWYQVQPSMGNNSNSGTYEKSKDEFIRILGGYQRIDNSSKFNTNIGYIQDKSIYNGNEKELISTKRIISNSSYEYQFKNISINGGINYKYIKPNVYTYPTNLDEHRFEAFSLFKHKLNNRLRYSINLRKTYVSKYRSPFTSAFAIGYDLINSNTNLQTAIFKISNGYKIPTFNQRYWGDQGNPDLKPEDSRSIELGYNYSQNIGNTLINITLSSYYTDVDNWIMWVNKGKWVPINANKVECIGGEFMSHIKFNLNKIKTDIRLNYFFSSSILKKSSSEPKNVGKQLVYTPRHNANSSISLIYNTYTFRTNINYTGERHNLGYTKILDDYTIINCSISKQFKFNKYSFRINGCINNLFDKEYQSWEYYAMPKRNFNISIIFKI
ncbi:MAG: TonB-dependent receptor [Marinifilaceae bacterium]|jgi:iron complex outermembrane receptor protein|nr:TonB-dependent receptor [Marinifilaceae bacterium]